MAQPKMEIPNDPDYPTLDHVIIWLDAHIGKAGEYQQLKQAFASHLDPRYQTWTKLTDPDFDNLLRTGDIVKVQFAGVPFHLLAFDNPIRCYQAFEQYKDKHIYFITSGTLGVFIIPLLIANYRQVFTNPVNGNPFKSIYVFCGNTAYHVDWLLDFLDYLEVFNHEADLLARMTRDVAEYFIEQGEFQIQKALRYFQWSKKVLDQYRKLGENNTKLMKYVERRTSDIETVLEPNIRNHHVNGYHMNGDDTEQTSEPNS